MRFAAITIGSVVTLTALTAADDGPPRTAEQIIESYVQDFRSDRFAAAPVLFGIEVPGEGAWHVRVTGERDDDGWAVELDTGPAPTPTFVYKVESATLRAIDRGAMNALTAQGKAFTGDYTPMAVVQMEGYEPSLAEYAAINPFSFHFWTRGFPEMIPFGAELTRRAHGGNFVVFYYQTGLRTAWYRINPEDRVRDDAREQAAPFPMLIVGVRGTATGEVDGHPVMLPDGQAVFIPPNAQHRWWNETGEGAEAILIMFGESA